MNDLTKLEILQGLQKSGLRSTALSLDLMLYGLMPPDGAEGMRKILLVRHGATSLNGTTVSTDRIRGWKDIPLSKQGKAEAETLAEEIAKNPPDVIVSSDLKRAAHTADTIADAAGMKVAEKSEAFRPWDVGKLAGESTDKAMPMMEEHIDNPDEPLPEGESFNTFKDRFFQGLHNVLTKHEGTIAIVAHHRNDRLLSAWKAAGFPADGSIDFDVFKEKGEPTGSVTEFNIPLTSLKRAT
jgi:broad specificity phosphatase PhoE